MRPSVTVWVPSYNHGPYLAAALDSVLAQTLDDLELVVVEDGSSDTSLEIAERYAGAHPDRVTLLTHPGHANRGVAESANLAIAHSSGRFLLGLASDDMLYPDTLERQVAFLERHPGVGCVYGHAHMVDEEGRRIPDARTFGIDLTRDGRVIERLVQGNTIPSMTAMFRHECLEQAGGFDPALVYSDWELFVRVAAHSQIAFLPRALAQYRVHGTNASVNVGRRVNLERSLEVTAALRDRAPEVGGRLAEPRVRAAIELQMGFLHFAVGEVKTAEADVERAFDLDPAMGHDGRWLADWLWSRLLAELLPGRSAAFARWFGANTAPRLSARAARILRRELGAAVHLADVLAEARAGHAASAHRAALFATVGNPRHVADRRLGAVLLDSIAGGLASSAVRATKRRLLPHR